MSERDYVVSKGLREMAGMAQQAYVVGRLARQSRKAMSPAQLAAAKQAAKQAAKDRKTYSRLV